MQHIAGNVQRSIVFLLYVVLTIFIVGCSDVTEEEGILNYETILALTPTKTPTLTPTFTPTLTPSPTLSPTVTPTPSPTSPPTPTPLPPTPTSNPALKEFSFCNQHVGTQDTGRFSAQSTDPITAEVFPAFERLTLGFDMAEESAPLSAHARMVNQHDYTAITGNALAPSAYMLLIEFSEWLNDDFFALPPMNNADAITGTYTFTGTSAMQSVAFQTKQVGDAGTTMLLALEDPFVYHLSLSRDSSQLRVEVARQPTLHEYSDMLNVPYGASTAQAPVSLYVLIDGDIWHLKGNDSEKLTDDPEEVTDIAVSRDGKHIAYCQTQDPGISPMESGAAVPENLWVMRSNGDSNRIIPDTGVNCDNLTFSPDSTMIAMSVDETGIAPTERSIRIVPLSQTDAISEKVEIANTLQLNDQKTQGVIRGGGWNRHGPQWIDDERLIYTADSPDNRSTIFIMDLSSGIEYDIGADIQVVDHSYRYRSFGEPLVSSDGRAIAVEAHRADEPGTDLLLLNANGEEQDVINQNYWARPLAWTSDNSLYYLVTRCDSTLIHSYELYIRTSQGSNRLLATGDSEGTIGDALALDDGLIYVVASRSLPVSRGPNTASPYSPSSLWFWNFTQEIRAEVFEGKLGITRVVR